MIQSDITKKFVPSSKLMKNLLWITALGIFVFIFGLFFAPERIWPNLLLANYYLISLGLGGILFIALLYVSNAGWGIAIRRIPEAMTSVIPIAGVVMIVLIFGIHNLYEWSHDSVITTDHLLQKKTWWLNNPFFIVRTIFYIGIWLILSSAIVKISRKQDSNGDLNLTKKNKYYSAAFIVAFALTITLASMDWIMSLEPHWFSTIFGVYNFAGLFLNALAVITIIAVLLKRNSPYQNIITDKHLHNLGKLIFAFSTFWMYIWFSQYLLIWYANIPEEVTFFIRREEGSWAIFTVVNVLFNWVIPFIVLLPRWTKKNEGVLLKVCIIIMIGHWIDLFWMIMPPFMKNDPVMNIWEIGPIASAVAIFFYLTFRVLSQRNIVPIKDPMLVESLQQN